MTADASTLMASPKDVQEVVDMSVAKLQDVMKIEKVTWFPHGITSIAITAKVANVEVSISVSGPQSAG